VNDDHPGLTPQLLRGLTLDTEPWLSCDDCFDLLDQYVELVLTGPAATGPDDAGPDDAGPDDAGAAPAGTAVVLRMRTHLAGCPACAEEATSLLLLAAEDAGVEPALALRRLRGG
jgi:hypothetical protein